MTEFVIFLSYAFSSSEDLISSKFQSSFSIIFLNPKRVKEDNNPLLLPEPFFRFPRPTFNDINAKHFDSTCSVNKNIIIIINIFSTNTRGIVKKYAKQGREEVDEMIPASPFLLSSSILALRYMFNRVNIDCD